MLGRSYFSHKQLHKKNTSEIQDMLMNEHGVNWNDLENWKRRGMCVSLNEIGADEDIPLFTADRDYIIDHMKVKDDE